MSDYSTHAPQSRISTAEFSVLVALMMSIVAISIDALLPALDAIRADIAMSHPNQAQLVVSALFFGMALGQLICGPLSDATGRKKVLNGGIALFLVGTAVCYFANDINMLLLGRFIQGLGVSGPYVSAISIVRDKYSGNDMARIMSLVMMIFVMVPALAPSLGQAVLWVGNWRDIFLLYVGYALLIVLWIFWRLEETLPEAHRIPMSKKGFAEGIKEVISNVPTVCYMICMGLFFGSFIGYLNSSQQIFQDLFKTGELFTLYFGLLAIVFGVASLLNSRLVQKWDMQQLSAAAVWGIIVSSALFLALHLVTDIQLWMFLLYAAVLFFCFGLVFGNINAMAMEPMGHVAGIAAAIIGSVSSIMSMSIGTIIGQMYNGSLIPVTLGFFIFACINMAILTFAKSYKQKQLMQQQNTAPSAG
ncbi:MAG: multidrug effflux MFS transporter [Gammaproteobacteria bacterium]|nr:multidrug effflux MFS transporter [Gammaproteobacteria bacterium]MBU1557314.1 multidrug effflux MFS transporter [Gammaproteobacteria bacterium]MBU2070920.1 multidrug effflux MFS transporter [Gammaproteobacteria bacterium]MBU2181572.1 multidrug effflux MFS transporter [Gammaproteobacteria bacterium]MBU2204850.1 multidrug effflux MFS transporter [Gammaproteobacteria bacterium]